MAFSYHVKTVENIRSDANMVSKAAKYSSDKANQSLLIIVSGRQRIVHF